MQIVEYREIVHDDAEYRLIRGVPFAPVGEGAGLGNPMKTRISAAKRFGTRYAHFASRVRVR
jgi:hypothetical protein